jgi:hypothetical protein
MATQTRFDLNAAIETWRNELAAQPQLTPDDRRELERHLADAIADLRGRGLNEEEAFWLARRRIGQPRQLAEEFVKENPSEVWRERIFWMALALVGSYAFRTWADFLMTWVNQPSQKNVYFISLAVPLAVLIWAIIVIRRRSILVQNHYSFWRPACGLLVVLMATFLAAYFRARSLPGDNMVAVGYDIGLVMSWVGNAVWPVATVLAVLLTQEWKRKLSKQL